MVTRVNAEQIEESIESYNFGLLLLAALGTVIAGAGLLGLISGLFLREALPIVLSTVAISVGILLTRRSFRNKLDEGLNPHLFSGDDQQSAGR